MPIMQNMGGAQISNIADPVNPQDAMTMNTANTTATGIPRYYKSGVKKTSVWMYDTSGTVSNGTVVFYLTDDGTVNGNAIFTNIYSESIQIFAPSATDSFVMSFAIAGNKKSITVTVNRLGTVIAGLIQFISAANGTTVYLQVKGD